MKFEWDIPEDPQEIIDAAVAMAREDIAQATRSLHPLAAVVLLASMLGEQYKGLDLNQTARLSAVIAHGIELGRHKVKS